MTNMGQILMYAAYSAVLTSIVVNRIRHPNRKPEGSTRNDPPWLRSSYVNVTSQSDARGKHILQKRMATKATTFVLTQEEEDYLKRIVWYSDGLVQAYDNPEQMEEARKAVPIEIRKMIRDSQNTKRPPDGSFPEFDAMRELMSWYRYEFMQWIKEPVCEGKDCKDKKPIRRHEDEHRVPPRIDEKTKIPFAWSNYWVECWKCSGCNQSIIFHRYNDPERLLKHRKGRCGEHANLFAFICLSLGLEVRVLESNVHVFDHMWTEVYFKSINRWVHCDPSEVQCDVPLMFELGWFSKISTVIAYSPEEVRDVTRRYTHDYEVTRRSVRTIPERRLQNEINAANEKRQKNLPESRLKLLRERQKKENEELMSPVNMDILRSTRISSSLELKKREGTVEPDILDQSGIIWEFNEEEMKRKKFHLSYSCWSDKYDRHTGKDSIIENWKKGVYSVESIERKVTENPDLCYLLRLQNAPKSSISWKFQLPKESRGLGIDKIKIILPTCKLSVNGYITITLFSENHVYLHKPVLQGRTVMYKPLETDKFRGESSILLKIILASGDWHTTQLFRSAKGEETNFDLVITLAKFNISNGNAQDEKKKIKESTKVSRGLDRGMKSTTMRSTTYTDRFLNDKGQH